MSRVATAALVVASVTISVPLALWLGDTDDERPLAPAPHDPRVGELIERLDALESRFEDLEQMRSVGVVDASPRDSGTRSDRRPVGSERTIDTSVLARMEQRLARLERFQPPAEPAKETPPKARWVDQPVELAKHTIVDPRASVQDKLDAMMRLRRVEDAYTPAMANEMVRLGQTHASPEVRAQVWALFDSSSHLPQLVGPLLNALQYDQAAEVRNEASETLGNYADDPVVLRAIEWAAEHDEAEEVRRKASRTVREVEGDRSGGGR